MIFARRKHRDHRILAHDHDTKRAIGDRQRHEPDIDVVLGYLRGDHIGGARRDNELDVRMSPAQRSQHRR